MKEEPTFAARSFGKAESTPKANEQHLLKFCHDVAENSKIYTEDRITIANKLLAEWRKSGLTPSLVKRMEKFKNETK